jgi:hypothetical protein
MNMEDLIKCYTPASLNLDNITKLYWEARANAEYPSAWAIGTTTEYVP